MPVATVFDPGGVQKTDGSGVPLTYNRGTELRCIVSAMKAWWPTGPAAKRGLGTPEYGLAPEGAEIHIDGVPWLRMEEIAILDARGTKVVDVRLEWKDISAASRADAKAERIAKMQAKLDKQKPKAATAEVVEAGYRDTVLDPIPVADGTKLGAEVVEVVTEQKVKPPTKDKASTKAKT
jgi:hypothetical protein